MSNPLYDIRKPLKKIIRTPDTSKSWLGPNARAQLEVAALSFTNPELAGREIKDPFLQTGTFSEYTDGPIYCTGSIVRFDKRFYQAKRLTFDRAPIVNCVFQGYHWEPYQAPRTGTTP